jgi:hypothetical protein
MTFIVSARDSGDFPNGRLAWDILRHAAGHNRQTPDHIDLRACVHLKPYSLACLAALGAKSGGTTILSLPSDAACREHLIRLGIHRWFLTDPIEDVPDRPTNVPIQQLMNAPGTFADKAMALWEREIGGLPANMRQIFSSHLDEMIYNALGHSASSVGCFVVGQAFPKERFVDVSIVDLGITIRRSLVRNPLYAGVSDDRQAIELAIQEGVTGTPPGYNNLLGQPNSGSGLTELVRFCANGNGVLSIISGGSCVSFCQGLEFAYPINVPFAGTLVNVRFLTG